MLISTRKTNLPQPDIDNAQRQFWKQATQKNKQAEFASYCQCCSCCWPPSPPFDCYFLSVFLINGCPPLTALHCSADTATSGWLLLFFFSPVGCLQGVAPPLTAMLVLMLLLPPTHHLWLIVIFSFSSRSHFLAVIPHSLLSFCLRVSWNFFDTKYGSAANTTTPV